MSRPLVVPDASVVLKWALRSNDEPDRDRALALRAVWIDGACDVVHAIAIRRRGKLITADRADAKKAGRRGHLSLLENWQPPA